MSEDEHGRLGKPKWWRRFWIEAAMGSVVCVILFTLYFSNYINSYVFQRGITLIFSIFCSYAFAYIAIKVLSEKDPLKRYKIVFVWGGVTTSIGIIFLVSIILRILNLPPLPQLLDMWTVITLTAVIAPTIGGLLGYCLGKRRNFRLPFKKNLKPHEGEKVAETPVVEENR
ncbi:MAG: hypothetical protein QHH18_05710 [Candidatus Bathyarchaeota archaeon]|jgi:hypothetical protein|nr:hypothetical protein [Candidatus Bathyarchaeota archaeon A05DMB-5]MDH7558085.1 hypothetical protein [Candidatus Bathyarchaeota archaeon]